MGQPKRDVWAPPFGRRRLGASDVWAPDETPRDVWAPEKTSEGRLGAGRLGAGRLGAARFGKCVSDVALRDWLAG